MELQLALDRIEKKRAIDIVESLKDLIDIVEIGTPFSIMQPIEIINDFKKISPCLRVLADYKILDGGYALAEIAYKAGADIVTVSAQTWDETILQTIQAARDYGKQVLVDMMGIKEEDIAERGKQIDNMHPDYICTHRAVSVNRETSSEKTLKILRETIRQTKIAVAGGIDLETLPKVLTYQPDLVIIGSAITNATEPRKVTKQIYEIMGKKK